MCLLGPVGGAHHAYEPTLMDDASRTDIPSVTIACAQEPDASCVDRLRACYGEEATDPSLHASNADAVVTHATWVALNPQLVYSLLMDAQSDEWWLYPHVRAPFLYC